MIRNKLLIGISLTSLAASTALAQRTDTTDASGNRAVVECSAGNSCEVDNRFPGNDRNFGFVSARIGSGNDLFIQQVGDDNSATITANGTGNVGFTEQTGDDHALAVDQTGDENLTFIIQGDGSNSATVVQVETGGTTGTNPGGSGAAASGGGDIAAAPGAFFAEPSGTFDNVSIIAQGSDVLTPSGTQDPNFAGRKNVLSVTQNGSNLFSQIIQAANGGASADNNSATVFQMGGGSDSIIDQQSAGNIARVRLSGGGVNVAASGGAAAQNRENQSSITQGNNVLIGGSTAGTFTAGTPTADNNPNSNNLADVALTGTQNSSTVDQNGIQNFARVSMLNGGAGATASGASGLGGEAIAAARPDGNGTTINQTGLNNQVRVSSGGRVQDFGGSGNVSRITQGGETSGTNFGRNHAAAIFQTGTLDTVTINQQNNNAFGSTVDTNGNQSGSVADIAQRTLNSTTTVTQRGTNFARISQGGGASGNNTLTVDQTDAGDTPQTTTAVSSDIFRPTTTTMVRVAARNEVRVSQAGITNVASVTQNAIAASATVFQRAGSRNNTARVTQNGGNNSINLNARIDQSGQGGPGSGADVRQSGTNQFASITQAAGAQSGTNANSSNSATVTQTLDNNLASVTQTGFLHSATVAQTGDGGAASTSTGGRDLRNRVSIEQTGDRHFASATQGQGVGPSGADDPAAGPGGAEFARGSGVQSAEIQIIQQGRFSTAAGFANGNSATVDQQGRGQFARIFQNGRGNQGRITQTSTATNAVAVIEQTGNGNSFFITQTQAGQFFRVTQTGNNNGNQTMITSGPNGGGSGTTTVP